MFNRFLLYSRYYADSIGYNSEKDGQEFPLTEENQRHRPVVYRDGQWLVGAMEKNEVRKRDLSGK